MSNPLLMLRKKAVWVGALFLMCLFASITAAPRISALSNTFYDDRGDTGDCDVGRRGRDAPTTTNYHISDCSDNHRVVAIAGENNKVPIERTYVQANFFNGSTSTPPSGQSITIKGAHLCMNGSTSPVNRRDNVTNGYYTNNTQVTVNMDKIDENGGLAGKPVTKYTIGSKVKEGIFRKGATSADCTSTPDITVGLDAADFQQVTGIPGAWFVKVYAVHINQHGTGACPPAGNDTSTNGGECDGLVNSFSIQASGGSAVAVTLTAQDATCATEGRCATLRARDGESNADLSNYLTLKTRFGAPCNVSTAGENKLISFYDLDYGKDSPESVVKLTLREEAPDGSVRWLWGFQKPDGTYANTEDDWSKDPTGTNGKRSFGVWRNTQPTYRESFQISSVGGGTSTWRFTALPGRKYVMYVENIGPHLAMQIGIPYDGVYALYDCPGPPPPASLAPNASFNIAPGETYEGGDNAVGTTSVTNSSSSTTGQASWERFFWFENGSDSVYNTGDTLISGSIPTSGSASFPPGTSLNRSTPTTIGGTENRICVSLRLHTPGANTLIPPSGNTTAVQCRDIQRKPWLQVLNGDVNTTKDEVNSGCTVASANKTSAFWRLKDGITPQGSGTQIALYAGGSVKEFVTAALRASTPKWEKGLTFANQNGTYGGIFGSVVGCNSDPDWIALTSDTYDLDTLSGYSGGGTKIYNGPLHISGPSINYPSGNFSLSNKPYLKVVVRGDIYIDSNVTNLDGIYMATGTIYTCTIGASVPTDLNNTTFKTACNNRLTVTGSLIANSIKFLRLAGGLNASIPAESITYDPLNWIPTPGDNTGELKFDSYTIMPPIL